MRNVLLRCKYYSEAMLHYERDYEFRDVLYYM